MARKKKKELASKRSAGKKALFALITGGLFFATLEGILFFCGVEPVLYREDPFVGFATHIPLFVRKEGPGSKAVLRTARNKLKYFNLQEFSREKSPGTFRIFGNRVSTVYRVNRAVRVDRPGRPGRPPR